MTPMKKMTEMIVFPFENLIPNKDVIICTINTKQMEFYGNDEGNDESYDSYASDDTS